MKTAGGNKNSLQGIVECIELVDVTYKELEQGYKKHNAYKPFYCMLPVSKARFSAKKQQQADALHGKHAIIPDIGKVRQRILLDKNARKAYGRFGNDHSRQERHDRHPLPVCFF